jgi:hypothetical protein
MSPVIEKLSPQQPIDACGLSNCMHARATFLLNQMKRFF